MSKFNLKQCLPLFALFGLLVVSTVSADENSFGYRIFEIQKKHAIKGSTLAQYKLGTFYEFGISVKPNPAEARVWYEKAAKKHNKPAADRIIYLNIRQQGYNWAEHSEWVKKIASEAKKGNVHSIIITGQLYQYGIGTKKDLNKALKFLRKASSLGHTEIDFEIEAIEKKRYKKTAVKVKAVPPVIPESNVKPNTKTAKPLKPEPAQKSKGSVKKSKTSKSVNKASAKKSKLSRREIKRRKYEKAMRKQYREELILQQQQEWSESEDWSEETEDDETESEVQ